MNFKKSIPAKTDHFISEQVIREVEKEILVVPVRI